jgi:hypothetical protein
MNNFASYGERELNELTFYSLEVAGPIAGELRQSVHQVGSLVCQPVVKRFARFGEALLASGGARLRNQVRRAGKVTGPEIARRGRIERRE